METHGKLDVSQGTWAEWGKGQFLKNHSILRVCSVCAVPKDGGLDGSCPLWARDKGGCQAWLKGPCRDGETGCLKGGGLLHSAHMCDHPHTRVTAGT